jgi:hypothetical protein
MSTATPEVKRHQKELSQEDAALKAQMAHLQVELAHLPKDTQLKSAKPLYIGLGVFVLLVVGLAFSQYRYAQQKERYREQGIRYAAALARIGALEGQLAKTPPEKQGPILDDLRRTVAGTGVPMKPGVALPAAAPPATVTLPAPQITVLTQPTKILSVTTPILVPVPGPVQVVTVTVTASPSPPTSTATPTATSTPTATATFGPTPSPSPCLLTVSSTVVTVGGLVCP